MKNYCYDQAMASMHWSSHLRLHKCKRTCGCVLTASDLRHLGPRSMGLATSASACSSAVLGLAPLFWTNISLRTGLRHPQNGRQSEEVRLVLCRALV